jgi:hypothetical protein
VAITAAPAGKYLELAVSFPSGQRQTPGERDPALQAHAGPRVGSRELLVEVHAFHSGHDTRASPVPAEDYVRPALGPAIDKPAPWPSATKPEGQIGRAV